MGKRGQTASLRISLMVLVLAGLLGITAFGAFFLMKNGGSNESNLTGQGTPPAPVTSFLIKDVGIDRNAFSGKGALAVYVQNTGGTVIRAFRVNIFGTSDVEMYYPTVLEIAQSSVLLVPWPSVGEPFERIQLVPRIADGGAVVSVHKALQEYIFDSQQFGVKEVAPQDFCVSGEQRVCYSGPNGTLGIGECKEGVQICSSNVWSVCIRQTVPTKERCDNLDTTCDGQIDEGCDDDGDKYCDDDIGRVGQALVCSLGGNDCNDTNVNVNPGIQEVCGNWIDDNCDGQADENCAAPPARKKPFISVVFNLHNLKDHPDRERFWEVMLLHWGVDPLTLQTYTTQTTWNNLKEYRRDALAVNPNLILAPYYSAITTQNPASPSEYNYPSYDYQGSTLRCLTQSTYDPHYDNESFYAYVYKPWMSINGFFGRWPFYSFSSRGWVLPQTTYICRPVIDIANPEVVSFVIDELLDALQPGGKHELSNGITFDNADLFESTRWHSWPGSGQPESRYQNAPPDSDFQSYLDQIRAELNQNGAILIANGVEIRKLAGHADSILWEGGAAPLKNLPKEEIKSLIEDVQFSISSGTAFAPFFIRTNSNGPIDSNPDELMFFLAFSMINYAEGFYAYWPSLNNNYFEYSPEYFELATWMMDPVEGYQEPIPYFYYRRFQNGIAILNANSEAVPLGSQQYQEFGFEPYDAPQTIGAKTGIILIPGCSFVTTEPSCQQVYQIS